MDMPDLNLELWRETENGRATLINLSENHSFRVDAPTGTTILRLHRPGYQTAASIGSELAWLEALGRDTDLPVVRPLAGRDGRLVQQMGDRRAVLFAFEQGREPTTGSKALFRTLGIFAATTHNHAVRWTPPNDFIRPTWSAANMLDPTGLWGDWRLAPGVSEDSGALEAVDSSLRVMLADYGTGADRFGLIHADMRLANLLVDGPRTVLLDFDDCGFGWFMYDLASALSFIERSPDLPALQQAWLEGYTTVRELSEADIAIIPAMILLRRMVLLAWIGTHGETELAQSHAPRFAADTVTLAEAWLDQS
jgi:Ser/Thr protein kinase RdoA (MazF antagonist)